MSVSRKKTFGWLVPAILGFTFVFNANAATYIINIGDAYKPEYNPNRISVNVGDTVSWRGDFYEHPLISASVPAEAAGFSNFLGNRFDYVVKTAGTYRYQSNMPHSFAMAGSFVAALPAESGKKQ